MGESMKGFSIDNDSYKYKIIKEYNNEYGLNINKDYDINEDYDRFFKTKNNLNAHGKIIVKK